MLVHACGFSVWLGIALAYSAEWLLFYKISTLLLIAIDDKTYQKS